MLESASKMKTNNLREQRPDITSVTSKKSTKQCFIFRDLKINILFEFIPFKVQNVKFLNEWKLFSFLSIILIDVNQVKFWKLKKWKG